MRKNAATWVQFLAKALVGLTLFALARNFFVWLTLTPRQRNQDHFLECCPKFVSVSVFTSFNFYRLMNCENTL